MPSSAPCRSTGSSRLDFLLCGPDAHLVDVFLAVRGELAFGGDLALSSFCVVTTLTLGSLCSITWTIDSGGGMGPKSLWKVEIPLPGEIGSGILRPQ